jgi:hypothetical protein
LLHPRLSIAVLLLTASGPVTSLLRALTLSASLLSSRHLPHRLASLLSLLSLRTLLPLLLGLLTLDHRLLATRFLLLAHLLDHLAPIGSLLLGPLPTAHLLPRLGLWPFLPLPTTTHLALLRCRALLTLLLPAASCLLLSRLRLWTFLTLGLLTLNLLLATSTISSPAILTSVTASAALPEHIGAGTDQRYQR